MVLIFPKTLDPRIGRFVALSTSAVGGAAPRSDVSADLRLLDLPHLPPSCLPHECSQKSLAEHMNTVQNLYNIVFLRAKPLEILQQILVHYKHRPALNARPHETWTNTSK